MGVRAALFCTLCAPALLGGLLSAPPAHAELLVTLYPLQADDLDTEATAELDQLLRLQAAELPGVVAQSRSKTHRAIKRSAGARADCEGRLRCLVRVGEATGASLLVFGSAARRADAFHLDLKAIEVDQEKILRRAEARLAGDAAALNGAARDLLLRLLLPDQATGTLAVRMLVPGARVLLDGIEVGVTPLAPLTGLQPRLYTVEVLLEGASPLRSNVQVSQAATTTLRVDLEESRLSGTTEQDSQLSQAPPPTVAHQLAARLLRAAPREPRDAMADARVGSPAVATDGDERALTEDISDEPAPPALAITGGAMIGAGALVGLLGAGGVAAWGIGYANASQYVEPSGSINDPESFDRARADAALHVGLGTAGGLGVAIGLLVLAGGVGLMVYDLSASQDRAVVGGAGD